jgi:hypothetical protein
VHSSDCFDGSFIELAIVTDENLQTGGRFALGKTICFGNLEFIANHFRNMSLPPDGNDSGIIFMGMVHSGSLSLRTILDESIDEDDTASSGRGKLWLPHLSRVQRGDPDHSHHHHTTGGEHSGVSDHPDRPTADSHTTA